MSEKLDNIVNFHYQEISEMKMLTPSFLYHLSVYLTEENKIKTTEAKIKIFKILKQIDEQFEYLLKYNNNLTQEKFITFIKTNLSARFNMLF